MAQNFRYVVKDRKGRDHKGVISAESQAAAASVLTEQGYFVTVLEPVKSLSDYIEISTGRTGSPELSVYCRNLAAMLSAGLSITQTLNILSRQAPNKVLRIASSRLLADLESGSSLSAAMGKYRNTFPGIAVTMVEAGELGGFLEETFDNLAIYFKKESELRDKIVTATLYPAIVTGFALVILGVLLNFVLPNFAGMFNTAGVEIPPLTAFLLDLSVFVKANALLILSAVLGLFVLFRVMLRSGPGKRLRDMVILKLPVIGELSAKVATSRFSRTLSTLLRSGVPILQALGIVHRLTGNSVISESILKAGEAMEKGESMSAPLAESNVLAPMVTQMIAIGEETGTLEEMLAKISNIYDEEIERAVKRLTSVLEPAIIIVLSVAVGIILLSVVIPMFDIITQVPG
ncbi:MAG: type II secretion system F family protein [Firmicutes bacterium HGW-Firmicutes-14]|nr:MAG: type II secretion system F family protein [Firmicutes bacterium HGW-Firmicutes-14]